MIIEKTRLYIRRFRFYVVLDETLKPAILQEIYNGDEEKMDKYHNFKLSYNYSAKKDFDDTPIAMVLDLMESYEQLGKTSYGWKAAQFLVDQILGKLKYIFLVPKLQLGDAYMIHATQKTP